ncbi:DgyrCDS13827 [Dimorphilus gyrociliatus]|uniref:DgyrCDS13827 n=1 Tax=Dimorphilus gyrociliatus TaxID=2664684 RepID=A0A7I8WBT3_9ANNE|nr:DgyrCDS13827 [Dimorphilus gyrociliatus]
MPAAAHVIINYGPYNSCGLVQHRDCRLEGLISVLEKYNHTVEKRQIPDWNVVEVWVNGEKIYSCDIRDLDYGGDGELDELCENALERVFKAF